LSGVAAEKGFTVVRYDDDATSVTACLSGQSDIFATSATLINQIGKKDPGKGFEPKFTIATFDLAIGVKKGEPKLLEHLNEWIAVNLKNGKLNDIYKKFHGSPLPAEMLK
jgi:polar amino acid transport system substrate-binding protein